ncbi:HAD family phosphatase [Maribellus sp. YY47]|uniref:HAD family hydrolase n=1 Tax=Maribellus sp. YY47 TaxID=2929486 RepID=UPI0020018356|nr:HAD family phosphatase [Maribellus sp. YY47]MCK3683566.1 HAD family phosphatase [Maribellus sp. YY47]
MKTDLSNIRNIIFDLGNVILNLDFDASIRAFQELGLDRGVINRQQAYADPVFYQLETGAVSPEEFRNRVREILNNPMASDQQIDDAWYAMIRDIPENRVETLKRLKANYRIFLFSNTNEIHISRLHPEFEESYGFAFPALFEQDFYSHEIHERKPDLTSFEKVIQLAGVNPEETLFVDDLEKNIEAAKDAGLKVLWLKNGMEMADLF